MPENIENQLHEDLEQFKKEYKSVSQEIRHLNDGQRIQTFVVNAMLICIIIAILAAGLGFKKLSLMPTLSMASLIGVIKIIWMLYDARRTNHFNFWIMSSMEFRLNEMDAKLRKILCSVNKLNNTCNETQDNNTENKEEK